MDLSSFLLPLISECRRRFGEWSLSLDMEQCSIVAESSCLTTDDDKQLPDSLQTIQVESCGKKLIAKAKEVRCKVSEPCCLVSVHLSNLIFCGHRNKLSSKHLESGLTFCNSNHSKTVTKAKLEIDDDVPDEVMTDVLEAIFRFHIQATDELLVDSIDKISFPVANPDDFYIVCINNEDKSFTLDILDDTGWKIGEIIGIRLSKVSENSKKKNVQKLENRKLNVSRKKSGFADRKKFKKSKVNVGSSEYVETQYRQNYNSDTARTVKPSYKIVDERYELLSLATNETFNNESAETICHEATAGNNSATECSKADIDHSNRMSSAKFTLVSTFFGDNNDEDVERQLIVDTLSLYTTNLDDESANFSQLGLDSFEMAQFEAKLRQKLQNQYVIPDGCVFSHNTILSLKNFLKQNIKEVEFNSVNELLTSLIQHNQDIPLSKTQQRLTTAAKLNPDEDEQYLESFFVEFSTIDLPRLIYAINREIARQNILRTSYTSSSQVVWSLTESFVHLMPVTAEYQLQQFKIFERPPVAFFLQQRAGDDGNTYRLIITIHHIAIDGESMNIFTEECQQLYSGIRLEKQLYSYAEYTLSEWIKRKNNLQMDEKKAYWRNTFLNPNIQQFPADNTKSNYFSHKGRSIRFALSDSVIQKLITLRKKYNVTMFSSLIGTFYILLNVLYGIDDYCIGVPVSQRTERQWQSVIGCFINLLPIRIKTNHNASISKFFADVGKKISESIANQIPFNELVKMFEKEDIATASSLFRIMVVVDRINNNLDRTRPIAKKKNTGYVKYDQLWYFEFDAKIPKAISVEYDSELLMPETIEMMIKKFLKLVHELHSRNVDRMNDLHLELSSEESDKYKKKRMNCCDFPSTKTALEIIQQQCKYSIKTSSVFWKDQIHSSASIQQYSNRLSKLLHSKYIETYGEVPMVDTIVVLLLQRTPKMISTIFALWNCGFAVVPISVDWSIQMIVSTIKQLKFPPVLYSPNFNELSTLCPLAIVCNNNDSVDDSTANDSHNEFVAKRCLQSVNNLAYITFTSGSTGRPKGVCTNFIGLNNLIMCYTEILAIHCKSTIYQVVNYAFDIAFADILEAFMNGANLLLAVERIPKTSELNRVTHAYIMPAYLSCLEGESEKCLTHLLKLHFGGEAISNALLQKLVEAGVSAYQQYGLTEHTVYTTLHRMKVGESSQTIGRPIKNTFIDCELNYGHRCSVSGVGLSRGYFGSSTTTNNAFRRCSALTHESAILRKPQYCFLTNDNLRIHTNGQVTFLGRFDRVVKIRGFAVNLTDVENYIEEHPYVQSCCSVFCSKSVGTAPSIIGCITVAPFTPLDPTEKDIEKIIKAYLCKKIPNYMIPSKILVFPQLPITPNGKTDIGKVKQLLMEDEMENGEKPARFANSAEDQELYQIFSETLNKGQLDINASMFENGGDSLKAMIIQEKLEEAYSIHMDILTLFRSQTVAEIIDHIKELIQPKHKRNNIPLNIETLQQLTVSPVKQSIPLSFQQEGLWITEQLFGNALDSHTIHMLIEMHQQLSDNQIRVLINYIIQKHASLRIRLKTDEPEAKQILLSSTESYVAPQYSEHKLCKRAISVNHQFPLKVKLCFNRGRMFLSFNIHHILVDGLSLEIIKEDFASIYSQFNHHQQLKMDCYNKANTYNYFAFSIKQREQEGLLIERSKEWIKGIKDTQPLKIPYDYSKKKNLKKSANIITITLKLPMSSIKSFCKKYRCAVFTLLITAYSILMSHISGLKVFTVGMPVANRSLATKNTVGLFANTVLIKLNAAPEKTSELIASIQESINYSLTAQKLPFELVVRCLNPIRHGSRTPCIYHSIVMHETAPISTVPTNGSDIELTFREIPSKIALYDQTWYFAPYKENIVLKLEYCKQLFSYERIQMIILLYQRILIHLVQEDNIFTILQDRKIHRTNNSLSDVSHNFHMQIKQQQSRKRNHTKKSNSIDNLQSSVNEINLPTVSERKRLEEEICKIWQDVLQRPVSVDDNFFSIGGHSINAAKICFQITRSLNYECSLALLFECQNIKKMVSKILQRKQTTSAKSSNRPTKEFPSSVCDLQIPMLRLYESKSDAAIAYNTGFTLQLDSLDARRLRICLNAVIMTHSVLRTSFVAQNHRYQTITHSGTECFLMLEGELEATLKNGVLPDAISFSSRLFCPFEEIPIRSRLEKRGENWTFKFLLSHLLVDRESLNIIRKNFLQLYYNNGPKVNRTVPYYEFSKFYQYRILEFRNKCENYWRSRLENVSVEDFSIVKKMPTIYSYHCVNIKKKYKSLNRIIGQITKHFNVTSFTVELAAFGEVLLRRIINGKRVIVAVPLSMRTANAEETVGFFLNTLPIVITFSSENSNFDKLQKTFKVLQEAYDHSIVSAEFLNDKCLDGQRIKAMITTEDSEESEDYISNWTVMDDTEEIRYTKYEITFFVRSHKDDLELKVEYSKDLYSREAISELMNDWAKCFSKMLSKTLGSPRQPSTFLKTDIPSSIIPELIKRSSCRVNDKVALFNQKHIISYQRLWEAIISTSRTIHQLITSSEGEFPKCDTPLPVIGTKSLEIIIICLSVMNIGASYLPLDKRTPTERLKLIFERVGTKYYITNDDLNISGFKAIVVQLNIQDLDSEVSKLRKRSDAWNSAYTIFTSGTTGEPKGVVIGHQSVTNLAVESTRNFFMKPTDCVYQLTNFCFDNSVLEIIMALSNGSALLVKEDPFVPEQFIAETDQHKITHALLFPSLVDVFDENELYHLRKLRYWIVGAEKLSEGILNRSLANGTNVIQNYGPTETTAYALYRHMHILDHPNNLGRPIANVKVFVSSAKSSAEETPNFAIDELNLQGICLMRGYIKNPSATAEPRISDTYCSGDLVYKQPDHSIIFIGRNDLQVKIRGFRIELTEIEAVLLKIPAVQQAKVIVKKPEKYLYAFLVAKNLNDTLNISRITNFCRQHLPYYMMPTYFQQIQTIPLTNNNKVDTKLLADYVEQYKGVQFVDRPETPTEEILAEIFQNALKSSNISVTDDFFLMGGNSLLAQKLTEQIEVSFNMRVPLHSIYECKTIRNLAQLIDKFKDDKLNYQLESTYTTSENPKHFFEQLIPLSFEQQQIYYLNNTGYADYYNLTFSQKFPNSTDLKHLHRSFHRMILKQHSLRTIFKEIDFNVYQFLLSGTEIYFHLWIQTNQEVMKVSEELSKQAFRFSDAPPVMCLLQRSIDCFVVIILINHIISDAWSTRVLEEELSSFYTTELNDNTWKQRLDHSYIWYTKLQQSSLSLENIDRNSEDFANYIQDYVMNNETLWNSHTKNPSTVYNNFQCYRSKISGEQYENLLKACSNYSCSPSAVFLSALTVAIHEITRASTVIVGAVASNRNSHTANIIGNFLNLFLVPSSFYPAESDQLLEHLKQIKLSLENGQRYQKVPILPLLRKIRHLTKKKFTPEILFNCRYDMEDGKTNKISVANTQEFNKCIYAVEMDVDLSNEGYHWTIRIHNNAKAPLQQSAFSQTFEDALQKLTSLNSENNSNTKSHIKNYSPSTTTNENAKEKLKNIWTECLNSRRFSSMSDFFFVGGDSLSCLKLKRYINEIFLVDLSIEELTNNSIFSQMLHIIEDRTNEKHLMPVNDQIIQNKVMIELNRGSTSTVNQTVIFLHPLVGGIIFPYKHIVHELIQLDGNLRIFGLQHPNTFSNTLIDPRYNSSIEELCGMYVNMLLPYLANSTCTLVGASLGGVLCYECANQLIKKGITIGNLIAIDSSAVSSTAEVQFKNHREQTLDILKHFCGIDENVDDAAQQAIIENSWKLLRMRASYCMKPNPHLNVHQLLLEDSKDAHGWSNYCYVSTVKIDGSHATMLDERHSRKIASIIYGIIDKNKTYSRV